MRNCIVLTAIAALAMGGTADADTLVVKSGNVPVGQRDPLVTVQGAPVTIAGTTHPAAPVPLQQALVLSPYAGWAQLPGSTWVGVANGTANSPSGGYVYLLRFELPQEFSNPQITLTLSSDNHSMALLNGSLIGSIPQIPNEWQQLFVFSSADPVVFRSGWNELEFEVENGGLDPSGIVFRADVAYNAVPEPSTLLALLCGVVGVVWRRRR